MKISLQKKIYTIFNLVFLTFLLSPTCLAQSVLVTPGVKNGLQTFIQGDTVKAVLEANRSYACTLLGVDSSSELGIASQVLSPLSVNVSATLRGETTPIVSVDPANDSNTNDNRVSLFVTATGIWTFQIASAKSGGEQGQFFCEETTLYGHYNTATNNFNFLELTNSTTKDINIIWILRNFDGALFTGSNTIPADRRVDLDIHTIVGQGVYGYIKIKHDAPNGAIRASISQYKGTPTDFTLHSTQSLKPRF